MCKTAGGECNGSFTLSHGNTQQLGEHKERLGHSTDYRTKALT